MTLSEAAVLLKGISPKFLEGLTPPERAALLEAGAIRRFEPGSFITHQGFPANSIALLLRGRARFTCTTIAGRKLYLRWIHPGEVCGLTALLSEQKAYLMSAEVVRASVALVWHRRTMRSFVAACPRLLDSGLLLAFDYLRLYQIAHISATSRTARQRLALVLGAMASGIGRKVGDGVELTVRNEDLANEANVTVFTASRFLNEWQREGMLVKTRGKIVLRSPEGLVRR
jgi:CRP-like cAMP-binding protein